jgi:hypothetical protein
MFPTFMRVRHGHMGCPNVSSAIKGTRSILHALPRDFLKNNYVIYITLLYGILYTVYI